MGKETLGQLIEKTRQEYQDGKNRVAFFGRVSSGKTIVGALLKYTLSNSWIPQTNGRWEAVSNSGQDEINKIIREMKKGKFTHPTPRVTSPKLVVDIYNMKGSPVKYQLILHDIAGENYENYLLDVYENIEERLYDILSKNTAYIPYAKKYVILIDCTEKEDWDADISRVGPMISVIKEMKRKIHNFDEKEKNHTPIAIIFTKADMLSQEDQARTAKDLAKDYPELLSSLNINHDKKELEFFKVSVSSTLETDEEAKIRIERRREEIKKEHEKSLMDWMKQTKIAIADVVAATKLQAEQEGQPIEEVMKRIENSKSQTKMKYKQQFDQKHPMPENKVKSDKQFKVNIPLVYTESEYIKFISWILDAENES